jgi:hypothetical protein
MTLSLSAPTRGGKPVDGERLQFILAKIPSKARTGRADRFRPHPVRLRTYRRCDPARDGIRRTHHRRCPGTGRPVDGAALRQAPRLEIEDAGCRHSLRRGIGQTENKNGQTYRMKVSNLKTNSRWKPENMKLHNEVAGALGEIRTPDPRIRSPLCRQ